MAIRNRRRHIDRVNTFILVWNGDEIEQVSFDGEVFNLPPTDVTATTEHGSPYKWEGCRDRTGEIIPGTILVADRHALIEGNKVKVFDADQFVKWIESIRSDLLDRGLYIVDLPEEVAEAKAEGRPIYEASQDDRARNILETELFRRRKWEERGTPAPPSSSEDKVLWALKHLRERELPLSKIPTEDIMVALGGGRPVAKTGTSTAAELVAKADAVPVKTEVPEPPAEGQELYRKADSLGLKLKVADLHGLMKNDVEVLKDVQGRIEAKEKELEAVAT